MRRIWSFQYFRALAACGVVVFHVLAATPYRITDAVGNTGIALFFVLSGFLIFGLTSRREILPSQFAADRLARIVPSYWVVTLVTFTVAMLSRHGIANVDTSPVLLVKSLLFIPAYNSGAQIWPTLYVGWTLTYEVFFYVVFTALLLIKRAFWRLAAMSVLLVGLVVLGRLVAVQGPVLLTYTSPDLLTFLSGAILAYAFDAYDRERIGALALGVVIAGVTGGMASVWSMPHMSWTCLAVLAIALSVIAERFGLIGQSRILKFLGDASYSIYLYQALGLLIAEHLIWESHIHGLPIMVHAVVDIVLSILLGVCGYVVVERPITRLARHLLSRRADRPVRIAAAA